MNRELARLALTILIASPIVLLWAYIRPQAPTPLDLVIAGVLGFAVSALAVTLAGRLMTRARRRRD